MTPTEILLSQVEHTAALAHSDGSEVTASKLRSHVRQFREATEGDCERCGGSGVIDGSREGQFACPDCKGTGEKAPLEPSSETLKMALRAIGATWNILADDEPNPDAATRAWREIRAVLTQPDYGTGEKPPCEKCGGSGYWPGTTEPRPGCPWCSASGEKPVASGKGPGVVGAPSNPSRFAAHVLRDRFPVEATEEAPK